MGTPEESRHLALSGAAVLLDVAAQLENTLPRHLWRLVFVDSDGTDFSAAEREAIRGRKEKVAAVVAVDRVGRAGSPLVAIPFPISPTARRRGKAARASSLEVLAHLQEAAKAEGFAVHEGDAGQERIFVVASRLLGMSLRTPAAPFAEQGAPTLLLTDASPSEFRPSDSAAAEGGTKPQQSAEIDPEILRAASDLLRTFLARADSAPPPVAPDDVVRFGGRRVGLFDLRNGLLALLLLAVVRLLLHRRRRTSNVVEGARLASVILFAAGVAVTAVETPVGGVYLYGPVTLLVLLLPPGRFWALALELAAIAVPLARLAFYLEVQVGGSGAFQNGTASNLVRQPALALVGSGLLCATIATAYLRSVPDEKTRSGGAEA